jgi:hypothetical protein
MVAKQNRFDIEWWIVQKRLIYIVIGLLLLVVVAGGVGLYLWLYGNPLAVHKSDVTTLAGARFISFEGDVRVVRAATRETVAATSQTQMYPGDIVQTQTDGRARIQMVDGSSLVVRPNSTVIIRDNTRAEGSRRANVSVVVDRGQINVRTEEQPEGTTNVVETPKTKNRLGPQTGATFGINPEGTEDIRVDSGQMETATQNGERTVLRGGEYVGINLSGTVARRERLLDTPVPLAPRDLERVFAGANGAANVTLRWQHPNSGAAAAHYRVEVATSPFFVAAGKVIERDQLIATEFGASDLRPGTYFWRVRATASSGQTSDWSEPLKFVVTPPGTNQPVEVSNWKVEYVGGNIYLARGRTQPGATVRINGRETLAASDGSFRLQVTVADGARDVVVQAQDVQGNSSQYKLPLSPASQ